MSRIVSEARGGLHRGLGGLCAEAPAANAAAAPQTALAYAPRGGWEGPGQFLLRPLRLWSDARSEKRGTHIDRHLTSHSCRTSFRIVSGGPMGSKRLQKNRSYGFLRGFWPFSRRGSPYAAALFMMRSSAARAHDGDSVFSRGCPRAELRADQN